ncbi:hypothetical protein [Pseudomonas indica]|uniref:hypothetical protein n=1 Tax=Pseudomonas indica TaxID=137658 RepID=UPI0023F6479E|nr:hypothetical protein [Pseudomonas indica]MBU3057267.1 hypothetical protein [Pseudomonas indica]
MSRINIVGWQILLSLGFLAVSYYLVFVLWYPSPLDKLAGVLRVYLIFVAAIFILGPFLVFVVFKKNRVIPWVDIFVVASLQVTSFFYGMFVIYQGRPVWLVFVVDDFELVRSVDIYRTETDVLYEERFWQRPRFVAAVYSSDGNVRSIQQQEEIFEGVSLARRPETFVALEGRAAEVLKKSRSFDDLFLVNDPGSIERVLKKYPLSCGWLPLKGVDVDMIVLVDKRGDVLGVEELKPW